MINEQIIKPLSNKGKEIIYKKTDEGLNICWGNLSFTLFADELCMIFENYFVEPEKWYLLGACMDKPTEGGLGEYIHNQFSRFTPRHASAIASVLYNEGLINIKGNRPIYLQRK